MQVKLTICIATFNRSIKINRLLDSIPTLESLEVSICDDGSTDDTLEIINNHKSRLNIKYIFQQNRGRAHALRNAIINSSGHYLVIMDSDDYFTVNGVELIIKSLNNNQSINFFVFPTLIKLANFKIINHLKNFSKINYISLRNDYPIKYDLKEILSRKVMLNVLYEDPLHLRRIPTSYLWFRASEIIDCLPVNTEPVVVKEYNSDGMTKNILEYKIKNPEYLVLNFKILFYSKKYLSKISRIKNIILFYRYSFHKKNYKIENFFTVPHYVIGWLISVIDIIKYKFLK
jgi:glycosyltransferase involved in cell wall biosynthesis